MRDKNWTQLDILRGISVLTMIFTHIWVSFFYNIDNILGDNLSLLGGFVSFPIFLFVSGLLMGYKWTRLSFLPLLKKLFILVLIYVFLGIVYAISNRLDILNTFSKPIFLQEYLIPLAIFPFIAYFIRKITDRFDDNVNEYWVTTNMGYITIGLFTILLLISIPIFQIHDIFSLFANVKDTSWNTFPILSYSIIFFIATWLGYLKSKDDNYFNSNLIILFILSSVVSIALYFAKPINIFDIDSYRFPPLPIYLSLSVSITILFYFIANSLVKFEKNILEYIGKYALHFFVIHIFLIHITTYGISAYNESQKEPVVEIPKTSIEIFLEKWEGSKKNIWEYEGERIYEIDTNENTNSFINIYVDSSTLNSNAMGYDITVYGKVNESLSTLSYRDYLDINKGYWIQIDNTGYKAIIISISDNYEQPTNEEILSKIETMKDKKLVADYTLNNKIKVVYKPGYVYGKKNILVGETDTTKLSYTISLPISCEDLVKIQDENTVVFRYKEQNLEYKCDGNLVNTKIDLGKKYSIGDNKLIIDLVVNNILGEEKFKTSFSKDIVIDYPTYVIWSLDWEGYYIPQENLNKLTQIRKNTQGFILTHMFNPRIWNTTVISKANVDTQILYVKNAHTKNKDEIALHLHMFKDMLTKIGITPVDVKGWSGMKDGYDVPFTEYKYEDQLKMCLWAKEQFKTNNLPEPFAFRAGGWFVNNDGLRAIKDCGMKIDTSGRTKYNTLNFGAINRFDGFWNLSTTTQPYWMSASNQNISTTKAASLGIYEIPNTGGDTWAFSTKQLVARFNGIYYLNSDKHNTVTFLSHPDYFKDEQLKMIPTLRYVDYFSNYSDNGSVIYTTLTSYYNKYAGVK